MKMIFAPVGRSKATKRDKSSLYRSIGTCWTSVSSVESLAPGEMSRARQRQV